MNKQETIRSMKLFLFDLDGTLYLGDQLYPFTTRLLRRIREIGGRSLYMTNNSSKSVEDYVEKLGKLGTFFKTAFGFGKNGFIGVQDKISLMNNMYLMILAVICCFPILSSIKTTAFINGSWALISGLSVRE